MASVDDVTSLSVRRGFLWPAVDLYGGFAGFYDYGHNGVLLRRHWEDLWLETFLGLHDNYYLIDSTTILPEAPLKASGHVDHFTDLLVTCTKCGESYRADHLLSAATKEDYEGLTPEEADAKIRELKIRCTRCKGELAPAKPFNMMFPVGVGPTGKDKAFLRPETAQGVYLNFKREFEALRRRLPMGLAIVGRAYRNEISPRQGTYRMREFLQAELQIFFDPASFADQVPTADVADVPVRICWAAEKNQPTAHDLVAKDLVARGLPSWYVYHLVQVQRFYLDLLGVPRERFRFAELDEKERAFYNKVHFDIQVDQESLGGFREVGGVHYRTDHDLKGHEAMSKVRQEVTVGTTKVLPHVLELSFGVDRNVWALLDLGYTKTDRVVLRLPPRLAPMAVAVFPLVSKDGLPERAEAIYASLRKTTGAFYDDSGSIGKRYARMDEIGTPYCVTVDHDTLEGKGVTLRERDSQKQVRIAEDRLSSTLASLRTGETRFEALA
ncbi:MAG: glycine--tRNA ligase [Candidatus Thermoplasmatota archaeon]